MQKYPPIKGMEEVLVAPIMETGHGNRYKRVHQTEVWLPPKRFSHQMMALLRRKPLSWPLRDYCRSIGSPRRAPKSR